jgi:hypothetical protein
MTTSSVAERLDGSEYPLRIPKELVEEAKRSGIVIVYGASDDLMEFEGAITDEAGAYEGTTVRVTPTGLQPHFDNIDGTNKDALRDYFANENAGKTITALWCEDSGEYSFTYQTDIPHETFDVMEEGAKYCRGIVFRLADCA